MVASRLGGATTDWSNFLPSSDSLARRIVSNRLRKSCVERLRAEDEWKFLREGSALNSFNAEDFPLVNSSITFPLPCPHISPNFMLPGAFSVRARLPFASGVKYL